MIFFNRKDIDDSQWNACIKASSPFPYAYSWYLDEMCIVWDALIVERDSKYIACFPIPWKSKFGIKYVYPPFFIQQLGLFTIDSTLEFSVFVQKIASRYKWVELYSSSEVEGAESRCNMVLKLNKSYEELRDNYSSNHKRNLKKAQKSGLNIQKSKLADSAINLFIADKGGEFPHLKKEHYLAFSKVCQIAADKNSFQALNAIDSSGELVCSALFFTTTERIIFAFSGNSKKGKETGALFLLLDELIREHKKGGVILDFEGSEDEGVSRFYKGFGASREDYYYLKMNNLPFPLKLFKS